MNAQTDNTMCGLMTDWGLIHYGIAYRRKRSGISSKVIGAERFKNIFLFLIRYSLERHGAHDEAVAFVVLSDVHRDGIVL